MLVIIKAAFLNAKVPLGNSLDDVQPSHTPSVDTKLNPVVA